MSGYTSLGVGYSSTSPTEGMLLIREKRTPLDGTHHPILCFHGHGGDSTQFLPRGDGFSPGLHALALAEVGYVVGAIDDGGGAAWGNSVAMARADDGWGWLTAYTTGPKIGIMGWSMGCLAALNWIKRNPGKVAGAWLWAPLTDLDWANSTGGYTPAYGGSVASNGTWSTEIQAAFSPYASASVGYRVRDEYRSWAGLGVPIRVAHASDDATIPVAQSQVGFVPGVGDNNVTLRLPLPTGGHTALFATVPTGEPVDFFSRLSW